MLTYHSGRPLIITGTAEEGIGAEEEDIGAEEEVMDMVDTIKLLQ